jgi:hypothetical protein
MTDRDDLTDLLKRIDLLAAQLVHIQELLNQLIALWARHSDAIVSGLPPQPPVN